MPDRPPKPSDRASTPRFKDRKKSIRPRKPSLGPLFRARPTDDDYEALFAELYKGRPRSVALVGCAYVQDSLRFALASRFVSMTYDVLEERLYNPSGPLNSMSQAIELGYAMGLYGDLICEDLHIIRVVRNLFAHTMKNISFSTPGISKEIDHLRFYKRRRGFLSEPIDGKTEYSTEELLTKGIIKMSNKQKYVDSCIDLVAAVVQGIDFTRRPGPPRLP